MDWLLPAAWLTLAAALSASGGRLMTPDRLTRATAVTDQDSQTQRAIQALILVGAAVPVAAFGASIAPVGAAASFPFILVMTLAVVGMPLAVGLLIRVRRNGWRRV